MGVAWSFLSFIYIFGLFEKKGITSYLIIEDHLDIFL